MQIGAVSTGPAPLSIDISGSAGTTPELILQADPVTPVVGLLRFGCVAELHPAKRRITAKAAVAPAIRSLNMVIRTVWLLRPMTCGGSEKPPNRRSNHQLFLWSRIRRRLVISIRKPTPSRAPPATTSTPMLAPVKASAAWTVVVGAINGVVAGVGVGTKTV